MEKFIVRLLEQRKANGLTQQQVAKYLGITQPSYIRYERGEAEPTLTNVVKLCELFDVSADYLLGRTEY